VRESRYNNTYYYYYYYYYYSGNTGHVNLVIDGGIPADKNVMQKEAEIKVKYKSLCIEVQ
jgi:hypothetical protein